MVFVITPRRMDNIQVIAWKLLSEARRNFLLFYFELLRHFNEVFISFSLTLFYTRAFYDSLKKKFCKRVRLTQAVLKDLRHWRDLLKCISTRAIHGPPKQTLQMHSNASTSIGQGGTLENYLTPGIDESGNFSAFGVHYYVSSLSPY